MMIANKIPTNAATDFRTRLLTAAEQVCAAEGLYDARIEDVTRFAGVAKGTFYLYFASKEAVVQAVIQEALRELGERCREASCGARTRSQRATALAAAHLAFYRERPGRMRLLHQARGILKFARPEWRPLRKGLEAHLEAVARLLDLPASFTASERLNAARLLFGATAGIASIWAATGEDGGRARFPADGAELIGR
ncbi:MAG: TetR/AcrR family transcriptional regulator, partial [Thermoanaerobaculia bacterium]|nr:TetR/AcrR family transcriptional regulator [Thermoanaerobaculia bacterium]